MYNKPRGPSIPAALKKVNIEGLSVKRLIAFCEDAQKEVPEEDPELDWEFEEVGEFGQDGWTISYSHKSMQRD